MTGRKRSKLEQLSADARWWRVTDPDGVVRIERRDRVGSTLVQISADAEDLMIGCGEGPDACIPWDDLQHLCDAMRYLAALHKPKGYG